MRRELDMHHLMTVFCTVVRRDSFTAAAAVLGIKVSSVSKAVSQLEKSLGVKLMVRTTRRLSLTDHGEYFYHESSSVIDRINTIRATLETQQTKPVGRLKITATVAVGQYLVGPLIAEFLRLYPDIDVELQLTDEVLDIAANGIDVAIRSTAKLKDSSLHSLKLASPNRVLVASPAYLEARGLPQSPEDLEKHVAVVYRARKVFDRWELRHESRTWRIAMTTSLVSNNYHTVLQAARGGAGIANLFDYQVGKDLETGRLVAVLHEYRQQPLNLYALYHQKRALSPKLDAVLEFLYSRNPLALIRAERQSEKTPPQRVSGSVATRR